MASSSTDINTQINNREKLLQEKQLLLNQICDGLTNLIRVSQKVIKRRLVGGPDFIPGGMAEAIDHLNLQCYLNANIVFQYMKENSKITLAMALTINSKDLNSINHALANLSLETKYSKMPTDYQQSLAAIEQRLAGLPTVSVASSSALHTPSLRPENEASNIGDRTSIFQSLK